MANKNYKPYISSPISVLCNTDKKPAEAKPVQPKEASATPTKTAPKAKTTLAKKYMSKEEQASATVCLHLKPTTLDALSTAAKELKISRNKLINKILEDAIQGE